MKKSFLLLTLLAFVTSLSLQAQISEGGKPYSFTNKSLNANYTVVELPVFDVQAMLDEDQQNIEAKRAIPYRFAKELDVDYDFINDIQPVSLPEGGQLYRLGIYSAGAYSLHFIFGEYELPAGAKLFLYSFDHKSLLGAFTSKNNWNERTLATSVVDGDYAIIELYVPEVVEFIPVLRLTKVYHAYRNITGTIKGEKDSQFGASGSCNIDINCPEGNSWQTEKHAVCRIIMGSGLCSGTLLNNTAEDGTPYFLTANHCTLGGTPYADWVFYFNWEVATCGSTTDPYPSTSSIPSVSGSTLRATTSALDFCLVEMSSMPPQSYSPYYAGWNKSSTPAQNGTGIHHPYGDVKKVCVENDALIIGNYGSTYDANSHWHIQEWDAGVTEGGSSGSALFDENHRVVGDLTGGAAACGNPVDDYYARFDRSWADYTSTDQQLKYWLDPTNSGIDTLDGFDPYGVPLDADFSGTPTTVNVGQTVTFTDATTGGVGTPTSWDWSFDGGTPPTATGVGPQVVTYNTVGVYNASLTVSDGSSTDTENKVNYIRVVDPNDIVADFVGVPTTVLQGGTVDFTDLSTNNPTSWEWSFTGGTPTTSNIQNPTGIVYNTIGTYQVRLVASNANYADTVVKTAYIEVVDSTYRPHADFMANFTTVLVGGSVDFYNYSTGSYDSCHWEMSGGLPATSSDIAPVGVVYNTIGDYPVTLILYSSLGNDTLTKDLYIHVIDMSFADSLIADFHAITTRLLPAGWDVDFEDLTDGYPTSWTWEFEGGTPSASTDQHPQSIVYSTPGIYDVTLIVSNGSYADTLTKPNYIVVTTDPWPDPNGYCEDTISNIQANDVPLTFRHLTPSKWGYFPGHNEYTIRNYAERFDHYTYTHVRGMLVPVVKAFDMSGSGKVRFTIWDVDSLDRPGTILGYKDIAINSFTPYLYHSIEFTNPVPVNGRFFAGFQLYYNTPVDTFVVYMAPNRGVGGENTLLVKKGSNWVTPSVLLNDTLNTSMAIKVFGCLVGVDELELDEHISVYPNPTTGRFSVAISDIEVDEGLLRIIDIVGRTIKEIPVLKSENEVDVNISDQPDGVYLMELTINNTKITKKITLVR